MTEPTDATQVDPSRRHAAPTGSDLSPSNPNRSTPDHLAPDHQFHPTGTNGPASTTSYRVLVVGAKPSDWQLVGDQLATFACLDVRWTASWTSAEAEIFATPRPPAFLVTYASAIETTSFSVLGNKVEAFAELAPDTHLVIIADRFVSALNAHLGDASVVVLPSPCSTPDLASALLGLMADSSDEGAGYQEGAAAGDPSETSFAELKPSVRLEPTRSPAAELLKDS